MLSILIPVYNFDIRKLVNELHRQATESGKEFELVCLDDASEEAFKVLNREIASLPHVRYTELPENIGRACIRNRLAEEARFPYLLFMDCDSQVESPDFIRHYLQEAEPGTVVYGGRSYDPEPPTDPALYLRWLYGKERECLTRNLRQIHAYRSFMTNNFMVPKAIFLSIKLDETIKGYGHEDTFFGYQLKKERIPVVHIDNPLRHIGLENAEKFLENTRNAIRNLHQLIQRKETDHDNTLYVAYRLLNQGLTRPLFARRFLKKEKALLKNLTGPYPSLKKFDSYRLYYLLYLEQERLKRTARR